MGSHQRVHALIEYLKKHFDLTILFSADKQSYDEVLYLDDYEPLAFDQKKIDHFLQKHPILEPFYKKEKLQRLNRFLQTNTFSHVIIEYIHLSCFLPLFTNERLILDSHDILYKRNESFKKNNQTHWIEITKEQELALFQEYDSVICIQEEEYRFLQDEHINSLCCPHPVTPRNSFQVSPRAKKNILFIGGYSLANLNAIKWFLDNVWLFFTPTNQLQLHIVGTVCDGLKHYGAKDPNIKLRGKVQNLAPIYEIADIAINPVQMGGGLKIKNIESMAYGVPLITTDEGAKGIKSIESKGFLVANSLDEWIEKLLSLIISDVLCQKISRTALEYIKTHFSQESCFAPLKEFIQKESQWKKF